MGKVVFLGHLSYWQQIYGCWWNVLGDEEERKDICMRLEIGLVYDLS